ncbi:MAG: hypothetical protein KJO69_09605 [Gammaproteobacteria bacterium]|nr:hypothetical protein [Gammaproteobacteria bacterium]
MGIGVEHFDTARDVEAYESATGMTINPVQPDQTAQVQVDLQAMSGPEVVHGVENAQFMKYSPVELVQEQSGIMELFGGMKDALSEMAETVQDFAQQVQPEVAQQSVLDTSLTVAETKFTHEVQEPAPSVA